MKLKEFNITNCVAAGKSQKAASVGINFKTGSFRFNIQSYELMGLKEGDSIVFHQDEEEPGDWYVEKTIADDGFKLAVKETSGKGLLFFNPTLAKQVAASVEFTGTSGKCLIAGVPTRYKNRELWCILTSGLINL